MSILRPQKGWCSRCWLLSDGYVAAIRDGRQQLFCGPCLQEMGPSYHSAAQPPASSHAEPQVERRDAATPGTLAAQYNAQADGMVPITWLYPCGYLY